MGAGRLYFAFLLLVSAVGCGSAQTEIQGTVAYDGKPIDNGTIVFMTETEKGRSGGGTILDGKYHITSKEGLLPGSYRVKVHWHKPTGEKYKSETGALLETTKEGLPERYNEKTELKQELKAGKNVANFDLKK